MVSKRDFDFFHERTAVFREDQTGQCQPEVDAEEHSDCVDIGGK
jgi:hypothetical protein